LEAEAGCGLVTVLDLQSLHGLTDEPGDYSGNVLGAQIARSCGVWALRFTTRGRSRARSTAVRQRGKQALGAVDTLETTHGSHARLHITVVPFAAIARDHPIVETDLRVLGT
jgi:hypothetical protein